MAEPSRWRTLDPSFCIEMCRGVSEGLEIIDRVFRGCFLIFKLSLIHLLG
jgi:hypothetical protein